MKIPERFLLIDDDPMNNRLCSMALDKFFGKPDIMAFTEPETGVEYIENECNEHPVKTVIFLDINMPTLSGWDVLDKLKDSCKKINDNYTIFILSSSIDPADRKKAEDNPLVYAYIEKPLSLTLLEPIFGGN